ncbi:MAG: hypothetical protein JOZ80_03655 [Acidobacteriaceae bacterium]|nr:hypothetical protein [Acidobacteriaceae bacterium]
MRIEIARQDLGRAFTSEMAARLVPIFKRLGFKYVTLDCEGYRAGSMNLILPREVLPVDEIRNAD